jgi:hypothetical protein
VRRRITFRGECQRSGRDEIEEVGWIVGKTLAIELAAVPGEDKELESTA